MKSLSEREEAFGQQWDTADRDFVKTPIELMIGNLWRYLKILLMKEILVTNHVLSVVTTYKVHDDIISSLSAAAAH